MNIDSTILITGGIFHLVGGYVAFLVTKLFHRKMKENPKFTYAFRGFLVYTFVFLITGILFIFDFWYDGLNYLTHSLRTIAAILIAMSIMK